MKHLVWMLAVLLMGVVPVTAESENPLTVNCLPGWGGRYRPLDWTPLEMTVTSQLSKPFDGVLQVSCAQDGYNQLTVSHPVVVTPGVPTFFSLSTRIAFNADAIELRLTDRKGHTRLSQELGLWDFSHNNQLLVPVNPEDLFIGVIGRRDPGLMRLQQKAVSLWHQGGRSHQGKEGKVVIGTKQLRMVPWDWSGFDSLDLLILYDPDWSQLRSEQLTAVCTWVRRGGRLLIVLGRNAFPVHNELGRQLPVTLGALKAVTPSDTWLHQRGLTLPPGHTMTSYRLEPHPGVPLLNVIPADSPLCQAVVQVGFGRLGVLGLDPTSLTGNTDRFWQVVLDPLLKRAVTGDQGRFRRRAYSRDVMGVNRVPQRSLVVQDIDPNTVNQTSGPSPSYYSLLNQQNSQRQVLDYLYGIEELRPMPIGWVVLLLVLLALLLGPVDYWVLKKLDRQPLTWITSLVWIVLFTGGAYYGVEALRAGDLQLRTVSVVDAVQGQPQACSTYLSGLFAPKSADYGLERMQPGQWFSAASPVQIIPRRYQGAQPPRSLACLQQNGNNWITSLPINIWTMQSFEMETMAESPGLKATVTLQGRHVKLSLDNRTGQRILRGCLLLSDGQGLGFGAVDAGQRLDLDQPRGPLIGWTGMALNCQGQQPLALSSVFSMDRVQTRSRAIETYLEQGAAVVCVQLADAPAPYQVVQPSCQTHHLRFERLVVFPQHSEEHKDD